MIDTSGTDLDAFLDPYPDEPGGTGGTGGTSGVVASGGTGLAPLVEPRPVTPLGILAMTLGEVTAELDAVDGVPADLRARLARACDLAAGLDPYVARCTSPVSAPLDALAQRTAAVDWDARSAGDGPALEQEMLSGHVEGQLLAFLVHATRATRVLEIGMFTGYSALAMAEALPDDGTVVACEIDPYAARVARQSFAASPHGSKISVEVGPALDTLAGLDTDGDSFDLVFLDADKAGYLAYLEALLSGGLLAPGALICVDNTLMQGEPWLDEESSVNGRAVADFNAALTYDDRVVQVVLPVRDGLTLVRRV